MNWTAFSKGIPALREMVLPSEGPPLWKPIDGPQTQAYDSEADELFYGGAAGGGKSDLILGLSTTKHHRSVIFRREYPQLRDLLDRAQEIVGARGKLNRGTGVLQVQGRKVQFGSCPHEQNKFRWQGRPHDLKAFDEVTHFTRSIFMYLKTWARTSIPDQRVRVVCTGNPPSNVEGAWVIDYWAPWLDPKHTNPAVPGELRWFVTPGNGQSEHDIEVEGPEPVVIEGETLHPRSRTFIPALLSDNPYLSSDAEYLAVIQALPEPLRSQMLYGRFDAAGEDDEWQVVPSEWYDMAVFRWQNWQEAVGPMTALGVDVARGGGDATVLAPKHGDWFGELILKPGAECKSGREVCGAAMKVSSRSDQPPRIGIDVIGVGASPYDMLVEVGAQVNGINFGAGSDETDRSGKYKMANIRSAAYWGFREALDPEHSRIGLPPDPQLRVEMLAARWRVRAGRIYIEAKDEIKARLGRSPDRADATVLAWYADRGASIAFW